VRVTPHLRGERRPRGRHLSQSASHLIPLEPVLPRRRPLTVALLLGTVIAGLTVRFVPLGLPPPIVKYGGSTLWALMIYWVVSTMLPSWRIHMAALLAATLATAIEFVKLYHSAPLDTFRHTPAGVVLLGQYFSVWDLIAYWLAICSNMRENRQQRFQVHPDQFALCWQRTRRHQCFVTARPKPSQHKFMW